MIERKTIYEKIMLTIGENVKKITDATSKSLSSVPHGTLWFQIQRNLKRQVSYLPIYVFFRKVLVMHSINLIAILEFYVKQLTFFECTVVAASDFKKLYDGQMCLIT